MYTIAASIPNSVFTNLKSKMTTKDVWDALKALYKGHTQMVLVKMSQQLQTSRCSKDNNVHEHFDKLTNLREQLGAIGKSIPDNEYTLILMGSLPESYTAILGSIATAAEMSSMTVSAAVVVKIATDEYDQHTLGTKKGKDEAFTIDSQKKKKGKRCDVKCEHCHKKGHTKAECWAKGGGNKGGGPRQKQKKDSDKSNVVSTADQSPDIEAWCTTEEDEVDENTPHILAMVAQEASEVQSELYDLGATHHMSLFYEQFITYQPINAHPITAANNKVFHAISMGDLQIEVLNGTMSNKVLLKDTLYVPDLCLTVVLIGRIMKAGFTVQFADDVCHIKRGDDGHIIGCILVSANGLFKVKHTFGADDSTTMAEPVDILMLHHRMGHISVNAIHALIHTGSITGLQVIDNFPPFICDLCKYAKMTRKHISKKQAAQQAQAFGDEIYTDVWGPSPTLSLEGHQYYITFTDDHTCYTRLEVLHMKDEAFQAYKSFAAWAQTQHGMCIKQLCSDRSGEFTSNQFTAYL